MKMGFFFIRPKVNLYFSVDFISIHVLRHLLPPTLLNRIGSLHVIVTIENIVPFWNTLKLKNISKRADV